MGLLCNVGGARGLLGGVLGEEVAGTLGLAFGDGDWDDAEPCRFGELDAACWADFRAQAAEELGRDEVPNLLAPAGEGQAVYLPANVGSMTLPTSAGNLRCASLPGLRRELFELAERWGLPADDHALEAILEGACDSDEGPVADAPEVLAFARLMLAANEAMRRDCPLWLTG